MSRIPKIIHYCFGLAPDFGGKPWSLVHYVGVASAARHIKPDAIYFYYEFEPTGPWWDLTKPLVTPVKIEAPTTIFGRPLFHPAHKADIVRLEKLIELGGIYLDADVLVQRSFDDLLNHSTVLGQEGFGSISGMANAVILAEPHAPFLERWYAEYKSFRGKALDEYWNEHSVQLPARLAQEHPDEITVLPPTAFFWPLWSNAHIEWLFASADPIPPTDAYANHLWESKAWKYLDHLTPGQVRSTETNFHRWARPYVEGLPDDLGAAVAWRGAYQRLKHGKRWLSGRLRGLRRGSPRPAPAAPASRSARRADISKSGLWAAEEGSAFLSGVGSRGPALDAYVREMVAILGQHQEELGRPITVVDVGCGDFQVGRALTEALPTLRYIGCDIVKPLIEHHQKAYSSDRISFQHIDVVVERPPQGDVCLIRQVLQHLSNDDIAKALDNLAGFDVLYVTEGQPEVRIGPQNPDKAVGLDVRFDWQRGIGRGVELGSAPFGRRTEEVFRAFAFPHEVIVTERVRL